MPWEGNGPFEIGNRVVGGWEWGLGSRMRTMMLLLALVAPALGEEGAKRVKFLNYPECIELSNGTTTVILGPHSGGRVLKYEFKGKDVLYLDPREAEWGTEKAKGRKFTSAGRFDIGPEYIIPRHEALWSGEWGAEITGPRAARMVSQVDKATGVMLTRQFTLAKDSSHLSCKQIIMNLSGETVRWCHWSRTFAKGGGIVVIPIDEMPARLPKGYVMYPARNLINLQPEDSMVRRRGNFLEILGPPAHPKLGLDSNGWMAYQLPEDVAFVKVYETPKDRPYSEVAAFNTSVWYPKQSKIPTVELEPIGPANEIAPNTSASFTEDWFILENKFPPRGTDLNLAALAEMVNRQCVLK